MEELIEIWFETTHVNAWSFYKKLYHTSKVDMLAYARRLCCYFYKCITVWK
jgi:hypothetical protein